MKLDKKNKKIILYFFWGCIFLTMINAAKIKTLLKFEGINLEDFTDEELDILMDSKVSEIESLTGLAIKPKHRRQVESHFHGDMIRLEFYPVMDFNRLLIDDTCVCPKHYNINMDLGIIYLDQIYKGSVIVEYISGQKDEFIDNIITPLVKDMVAYAVTYNKLGMGGPVSSIKEGDVSVNYDTNNGYGSRITNQITDMKSKYCSARLRWL